MNTIRMTTWVGVALMLLATADGRAAAPKIAVLDMNRLIKAHPEAREADAGLKKRADEFEAEQKSMIGELEKMKKDFEAAREEASDKALSDTARQQKIKVAEQKFSDLKEQEQTTREKLMLRQQQLSDLRKRMRESIEGKIRELVAKHAKDNGYSLVMDMSGKDSRGSETVVFSQDGMDITEEIAKLIGVDKKDLKKEEKKD